MCTTYSHSKGLTLLELLIVVAILAIAASVAVPNLTNLIRSNTTAVQVNELISLVHLARSQAIRSNDSAVLRLRSANGGWDAVVVDGDDQELKKVAHSRTRLDLPEGGIDLIFDGRGFLPDSETITLRHESCAGDCGQRQQRTLEIMTTGRVGE